MPSVQIPILNGIYADTAPDLRTAYPINLVPSPKNSGISTGYLRPGDGLVEFGDINDLARGGIVFNSRLYYVCGDQLFRINEDGTTVGLGGVDNNQLPVSMCYGFDYLGLCSDGVIELMDKAEITYVITDPDVGYVIDLIWVDGYFMFTDGEVIGVTELNDPFNFNPIKYASSEADPDPIVALKTIRNEVYAVNRHTVEVFDNVGGAGFPFARIEGAQIEKGAVGTHAVCVFMEQLAFLGSGNNEQNSVYIGFNGAAQKISTQEIDMILGDYPEEVLALAILEQRNYGSHWFLYLHLDDRTMVYDAGASAELGAPVWFRLSSSGGDVIGGYRARFFTWCFSKWIFGDTALAKLGYLSQDVSSHFGAVVPWEFQTPIVYNESKGALFNKLELVALTGSYELGEEPTITTSYSLDGVTWAQDRAVTISAGTIGQRAKQIAWFQQGYMSNWRIQRFQGDSLAHMAFIRLEADLEPLAW